MRIAAGAEWGSEHPVARAIVSAHGGAAPVAESFASHAGFGVQALLEGSLVVAGRPKWVEDQWSVHLPIRFRGEAEMLEAAGGTVIAVAHDGDFLGIVAVSDTVKTRSADSALWACGPCCSPATTPAPPNTSRVCSASTRFGPESLPQESSRLSANSNPRAAWWRWSVTV